MTEGSPPSYIVLIAPLGKLLCAFERSTLLEHSGRRVVVVRVQRILEPMQLNPSLRLLRNTPARAITPREGELIKILRGRGKKKRVVLWAVDVDKEKTGCAEGLRVLFDNEQARLS